MSVCWFGHLSVNGWVSWYCSEGNRRTRQKRKTKGWIGGGGCCFRYRIWSTGPILVQCKWQNHELNITHKDVALQLVGLRGRILTLTLKIKIKIYQESVLVDLIRRWRALLDNVALWFSFNSCALNAKVTIVFLYNMYVLSWKWRNTVSLHKAEIKNNKLSQPCDSEWICRKWVCTRADISSWDESSMNVWSTGRCAHS